MPKKVKRQRRSQTKMEDIPMTPMIDVVFQLLVYFVFTFEIPPQHAFLPVFRPAAPPPSSDKPPPPKVIILVLNDVYLVNEAPVSNKGLEDWLFTLADLDRGQPIVIQTTRSSKHERLMFLLDLCEKAKLESRSILTVD